jgi:hypothetical protein
VQADELSARQAERCIATGWKAGVVKDQFDPYRESIGLR